MQVNLTEKPCGKSIENPVYVLAKNKLECISFEYEYLMERYGEKARLLQHNILIYGDRVYDEVLFLLPNGNKETTYFDVTSTHKKSRQKQFQY